MEDRLQQGANKWRQGLFDSRLETKGEDKMELKSGSGTHLCNIAPPEKWEKVNGTMDTESGMEYNGDPAGERAASLHTGKTTSTAAFLTREGEGVEMDRYFNPNSSN